MTRAGARGNRAPMVRPRALTPCVALLATLAGPSAAFAAEATPEVREQEPIRKVERGVFAVLEGGPSYLVASDAAADYGFGLGLSVHLGYDILPVLNLSVGASALLAQGTLPPVDGAGAQVDDRLYLTPSLRAQFAVFTTERHFVWVRAEAGLGILGAGSGEGAEASFGPALGGAVGWEYFTVLRHFSLGLQAGVTAYLDPDTALAIAVHPTLKYTF